VLTENKTNFLSEPWLGEVFPNPSSGEARIKAFIPHNEPFVVFQMVELGTGKVISGRVLEDRGNLELFIDCSKAASGAYGYQLLLGKKVLGVKKLIIQK
jgi:hypothetical protein